MRNINGGAHHRGKHIIGSIRHGSSGIGMWRRRKSGGIS
jgi:hypothetical protein